MRIPKSYLWIGGLILVAAYLSSGFYFVQADERGVVRWFGRVPDAYRSVPPGVHYAPPWPICSVDCPRTTEIRRVYVGQDPGQRDAIDEGEVDALIASPASDVLTGDVNILKLTMVVQYHVGDPADYLFGTEDPERLIRTTVKGVLMDTLAGTPVDESLTAGKAMVQLETLSRAQALLDEYRAGVRLVATNLESVAPPRAVIDAFQEVVSAKKDGEKAIDFAVAEENRILPRARGEAARIREEAAGYRQMRISEARGDAARFLSVLAEYRRSPEVFKERVVLETFERVLPSVRSYVLDPSRDGPATRVRIIEANPQRRAGD